ncbi:MAG: isoleucine--tRNA ligase, partial [Ilumatobacteraceae bacterium]
MTYPDVPAQPSFPDLERDVLDHWAADSTFQASIDWRDGADEYVFYDGPPFANGLPHYGHLLTGFVKDAVPRYRTMRGQQVHRRFGWDCHGLPAEVVAEKELGISGHPEIAAFGIDRFNDACRSSVLRFTDDWRRYVTRQARWVDFDNDYKTLDTPYMESVMWAFKTLWDKGLVYEGYRVLAYCWRCETPLSNTETRMDDVYQDRQDPAVTVRFRLDTGEDLLAWTTTPWTLPSNLALAVGPDIDYALLEMPDGQRVILADSRRAAYERELEGAVQLGSMRGSDLVGRGYKPLFDFFAEIPNAFHVLAAEFVSTDDGTGVVHLAPGFGEDDQTTCSAVGIPTVCPMDEKGCYTDEVGPWAGVQVFDANPEVIRTLRNRGALVRHDSYMHPYPHCWRCSKPLVYRAISSWFVEVTAVKQRMVELNQGIRWVPEHLKDGQFGKWLENARDWSISRNRFWGSPIPVWKSDDPAYPRVDVYGSIAELERDFGITVTDLHRPHIDNLVRPNPDDPTGKSMMRRVPEVLDCWFESGSMPFAQVHYPFENREWFESHYPGDFIVEYIGQTRGWFYTLHVLATALFDRPSFTTCVSHGIVLGNDGRKMSKSLMNYPDPLVVFDSHGSDAMRWYLLGSPILRGNDLMVTDDGLRETVRHVLLPIWNTWYFLSLYANAAGTVGSIRTDSTDVLDRYVLAKTHNLVADLTGTMDEYDLFAACGSVRGYLDVLTNWYVRRSRERFWAG